MLQAVCINDFLDDGKMRVKPLEDLMLSTWAKSASEDRLFRECSGISETKSDIKITCEITLRFFSPHPLLSGYVPRRAQINVNYDYYVMNLVRAFNLIRTLVEFKTYLFNVGGTMADTFGAISLSNMTRLLERRVPQKPIRYQTIPRLVVQSVKLQPRSFPYNLPIGPHRPSSDMSRPPALGLGNIRGLKEKRQPNLTSQESDTILPPIMKEQDRGNKESLSLQEKVSCYHWGL